MPKINKYIIVNLVTNKYYCGGRGTNECKENINNAEAYDEAKYNYYRKREDYLHPNEKFAKINENGILEIME